MCCPKDDLFRYIQNFGTRISDELLWLYNCWSMLILNGFYYHTCLESAKGQAISGCYLFHAPAIWSVWRGIGRNRVARLYPERYERNRFVLFSIDNQEQPTVGARGVYFLCSQRKLQEFSRRSCFPIYSQLKLQESSLILSKTNYTIAGMSWSLGSQF